MERCICLHRYRLRGGRSDCLHLNIVCQKGETVIVYRAGSCTLALSARTIVSVAISHCTEM